MIEYCITVSYWITEGGIRNKDQSPYYLSESLICGMQQSHEICGTDYRLISLVHWIQKLILKLSTKPKFPSMSVHSPLLKVRQSRNVFFKLTILPKHERTNWTLLIVVLFSVFCLTLL